MDRDRPKSGVVPDEAARAGAIARVCGEAEALGFEVRQQADAVIEGTSGNPEHFAWLERSRVEL